MLKKHSIATSVVALGLAALLGGGVAVANVSVPNADEVDDVLTIKLYNDRRLTGVCWVEMTLSNVEPGIRYIVSSDAFPFVIEDEWYPVAVGFGDRSGRFYGKGEIDRVVASSFEVGNLEFRTGPYWATGPNPYSSWSPGVVNLDNRCTAPF
jgi:hypothetical protein